MKKFKFNLEPVLKYKKALEREREWKLGVANQELRAAHEELSEARANLDKTYMSIDAGSAVDVFSAQLQEHYRELLAAVIEQKRKNVAASQTKFNDCRVDLTRASQEKEVIDTLKDKAVSVHRLENNREQQTMIDEISAQKQASRPKGETE
ncbi:MAG TPA: flagellar export protein FliJ [Blastocatellia bacterium]|nr:flagellar export protein FliJ [Blastocatellia bacterium]